MQRVVAAVMFLEIPLFICYSYHSVIRESLETTRFTHRDVNTQAHVSEYLKDLNTI
jgi:hypothetical protein